MKRFSAEEAIRLRDEAITELRKLDNAALREIERRMRFGKRPDGHARSRRIGRVAGGDMSDSVVNAVDERVNGKGLLAFDPQVTSAKRIMEMLTRIRGESRRAVHCWRVIEHQHKKQRDEAAPPGSGFCFCGHYCTGAEDDRLRDGYCPTDYEALRRARRAGPVDRVHFEARRLADKEKRELRAEA